MPEPEVLTTTPAPHTLNGHGAATLPKEKVGKKGKAGGKPEREEKGGTGRADRAAENLLRIAFAKHEQLSAMADNKAHIMLTIGVAVLGVSATQLFDPQLQYAAFVMIATSLVVVGLAVLATMPTLPTNKAVDPKDPTFNIAFFRDFARLPYDAFLEEMERMLADRTLTDRALLRDLYSHGQVLNGRKFRLLGLCYRVFFGGLLTAALVLLVTLAALWR